MSKPETLHLRIDTGDEISLPAAIADTALTLPELGALVVLSCIEKGFALNAKNDRTEEMKDAITSLRDRGVLKITSSGHRVIMSFDLTVLGC